MLGGELCHIERLAAGGLERCFPQYAHQHGAHQREGHQPRIARANLAVILCALDQGFECAQRT